MASTEQIFVSPGIFTSEKDLTFVTRQVGVTTLGLVGETPKGPAFEPVFISDYAQFQSYFGSLNPEKYVGTGFHKYETNYISKAYLTQTNQLYVTRVLGFTGFKAGHAWSITIDAALDPDTVVVTDTGTTYDPLVNFSATTAGTLTNIVFNDTNGTLQTLYNLGFLPSDLSTLPTLLPGETLSLTTPTYYKSGTGFFGATYEMTLVTGETSGSIYTGYTSGTVVEYSGTSYSDVEDMVVATLRSKGNYNSDEVLEYLVSGSTDVVIASSNADYDPLANFTITGVTADADTFSYEVSMDRTKKTYLPLIFGGNPTIEKPELFIEEFYYNTFIDLVDAGKVNGINSSFTAIDLGSADSLDDFEQEYQSAVTPWVLSELRGNVVKRLFRLITISDGNAANEDIKVSILNIKPDERTFDLVIRSYFDTDDRPNVLEQFSKLSMNPNATNFVGRRLGTADGEFPLRSRYVMVEFPETMTEDGFPAGFEGVPVRDYVDTASSNVALPPNVEYKTIYTSSDKVRKTYLGLNSNIGFDQDFFDYKGLPQDDDIGSWTGRTDGFHLDSGATNPIIENSEVILGDGSIFQPNYTFQTGNAEFRDDSGLDGTQYERINSRKFTFAPFGGFDGWDIYRKQRTNTDTYRVNGTKGAQGLLVGTFENKVTSTNVNGLNSDYYAYFEGIRTFDNPDEVNINVFATPGIDLRDNFTLIDEAVDMVEEERADSIYIVTLPDTDSGGAAILPQEAIDIVDNSGIDSNYSATYFPWIQMNDDENTQYVWLPPTIEVLRNIAYTDNVAFPWFATAGVNRGVTNAIKARRTITQAQQDDLYEGRINSLRTFTDVGVVIFGNITLQDGEESALSSLNIRRMILQARKLISAVSIRLLFEQNDNVVRNQFTSLVNPILNNIRRERGLEEFRVELVPSSEASDRRELCGKIFIKPIYALEFICVEFNLTNEGASFDNI
jgi:hypothetical protein